MQQYQYNLSLIHHEANGSIVQQRASDGYINATALCQAAGKRIAKYLENSSTQEFLSELATDVRIRTSELIQIVKGGIPENQGTWVHPQVAINLAQWLSPKFAVKVSKWVYDWMSGKGVSTHKRELPYHIQRHMMNHHKIPLTHFSILQEMTFTLLAPMESYGYSLPEHMLPDISQGKMFSSFLRQKKINPSTFPTYIHEFPDGRRVEARLYPIEFLSEFRLFIANVWMPTRSTKYFKERDPAALPYLDKVLQLTYHKKAA